MSYIALSDSRVSAVPCHDCGESLVSLAGIHERIFVDDSAANVACVGYPPAFLARQSVADRLLQVVQALPIGVGLLIKEALRPAALQAAIFERRLKRVAAENPGFSHEQCLELAAHFVAPPWVAGHPTGGAIDLTLCDEHGNEFDMGCGYDEDAAASEGRCYSNAPNISVQAAKNRATLFAALEQQGFVNYPFEWWHWSYGDKYWALMSNAPHAIYGAVD